MLKRPIVRLLDALLWLGALFPVLVGIAWADSLTGLNTLTTLLELLP